MFTPFYFGNRNLVAFIALCNFLYLYCLHLHEIMYPISAAAHNLYYTKGFCTFFATINSKMQY